MLGFGVPVDLFFAPGGMLPNGVLYASNDSAKDTQLAAFGQIDWKATDRLTLTLGGRVSRTKFSFDNFQDGAPNRSEEHTSELQSLMRISYAVSCLKKKNTAVTCI